MISPFIEGSNSPAACAISHAGTAIDRAVNSASDTIIGINVDLTKPTINGTVTNLPNAQGRS